MRGAHWHPTNDQHAPGADRGAALGQASRRHSEPVTPPARTASAPAGPGGRRHRPRRSPAVLEIVGSSSRSPRFHHFKAHAQSAHRFPSAPHSSVLVRRIPREGPATWTGPGRGARAGGTPPAFCADLDFHAPSWLKGKACDGEGVEREETNGTRAARDRATRRGVRLTVSRGAATVLDGVELGFSLGDPPAGGWLPRGGEPHPPGWSATGSRCGLGKATGPHDHEHHESVRTFREEGVVWQAITRMGSAGSPLQASAAAPPGRRHRRDHRLDPHHRAAARRVAELGAGLPDLVRDPRALWAWTPPTWRKAPTACRSPALRPGRPPADHRVSHRRPLRRGPSCAGDGGGRTLRSPSPATTAWRSPAGVAPWRVVLVGTPPDLVVLACWSTNWPRPPSPRAGPGGRCGPAGPGGLVVVVGLLLRRAARPSRSTSSTSPPTSAGNTCSSTVAGRRPGSREIVALREPAGSPGAPVDHLARSQQPEDPRRLALRRSRGSPAIKVDFMESESKDRYRWYDTILTESARLGLMVNFHGSVIPRGWAAPSPGHRLARRSGAPSTTCSSRTRRSPPAHNVIQPFTRNIVGGDGRHPGRPSAPRTDDHGDGYEPRTSSVAFESGITPLRRPCRRLPPPPAGRPLRPRAWPRPGDETVLLAGDPDTTLRHRPRAGPATAGSSGGIAAGEARTIHVLVQRLAATGRPGLDRRRRRRRDHGHGHLRRQDRPRRPVELEIFRRLSRRVVDATSGIAAVMSVAITGCGRRPGTQTLDGDPDFQNEGPAGSRCGSSSVLFACLREQASGHSHCCDIEALEGLAQDVWIEGAGRIAVPLRITLDNVDMDEAQRG